MSTPSDVRAGRRAVIITAIPIEFAAVRAHLRDGVEVTHPRGTVYELGTFGRDDQRWSVAVAEVGPGNDAAALEAERAIQHFEATHALFVGVAGGLKDVRLGDVVAATHVYGYESGKDASEFRARPSVGESSYDMVQRARAVSKTWAPGEEISQQHPDAETPRAFVGPIAAGSKVVASIDSATAVLLRQSYGDALAVEMEGRGFLRATHATPGLRALVVRGISDLLDGKAAADAGGWQKTAARHAAHFAFAVLAGLSGISPDESQAQIGSSPPFTPSRDAPPMIDPDALREVLGRLYPQGPLERHVWERAGGDVAVLDLGGSGRDAWFSAIRHMRRGGGGASPASLLVIALEDFPESPELRAMLMG